MIKKNKNNYYSDEDQINFEKLNNFKKFNSNIQTKNQLKNHSFKYSGSDEDYFNKIIKIKKNSSFLDKTNNKKQKKY